MPQISHEPVDEDAVLKEVWNPTDIDVKTELNDSQISTINKLLTLGSVFGSQVISEHLSEFMRLQKSRNRKSMDEFVNVVRARREDFVQKGKGFFGSLFG